MALFKNMAITNQGMALYAKAQAGQEIYFTKMQVGSGQIETQNPVTLLALLDPKLDVPITSITANPEMKNATIIGNITNKDVTEATYICELGLFAKDPDEGEILYGYVSAGQYGDYYAPEAQGPYSWQYEINAAIGNAANVIAEVSRLNWDHSVINSNKTFLHLTGGNQKEINKSIDDNFESVTKQLADITTKQGDLINLKTTNKTNLVNAVNELFQNANNGKSSIANVVGNPLLATDTFQQQRDKIQSLKNTFANNLTAKEQPSSGTESLKNLIDKIASISISKYAEGTINVSTGTNGGVTRDVTLNFRPDIIFLDVERMDSGFFNSVYVVWFKQVVFGAEKHGDGRIQPNDHNKSYFKYVLNNEITFKFSAQVNYNNTYTYNWYAYGK